jgi:hypothetical protein
MYFIQSYGGIDIDIIRVRRRKYFLRVGNSNGRKRILSTRISVIVRINMHGINADVTSFLFEL